MRRVGVPLLIAAFFGGSGSVLAVECPGHPGALGTGRVLIVDPHQHTRIGTMQYQETLPLAEKEVVLSFDDAPVRPYTNRVLDTLAADDQIVFAPQLRAHFCDSATHAPGVTRTLSEEA